MKSRKRLFTPDQVKFIREHAPGRSNQDLTDLVNETFGLSIALRQMKIFKKNNKISSGLTGRWEKGHEPANKGTKGLYNVGGNRTSFKKGDKPHNDKPIGTERINENGYVLIKVCNEGPHHKRWRHKHHVIWEKENGKVPKGHCLIFLDQNKQNLSLDNIQLITRKQLSQLNRRGLLYNDAELTKTGINIVNVFAKITEKNKKKL